MNFYEISQNNSGGSFSVDDKLCHCLFIEAKSSKIANAIAEHELGVYFDGVEKGIDCGHCGDRWKKINKWNIVDLEKLNKDGFSVKVSKYYDNQEQLWQETYGQYKQLEKPCWNGDDFTGKVFFDTIKDYAQFLANEYGWTKPDCRIFYNDGEVVEVFKQDKE